MTFDIFTLFGLCGFGMIAAAALLDWLDRRTGPAHDWSEEFEIGGQEYEFTPGIICRTQTRKLRICNVCMITDAMSAIRPYCKGPQSHGHR